MCENIELWSFLKQKGLAFTGGQAKVIIRSGEVRVNGEVEQRKKRKLKKGDTIEFNALRFVV